MQTAQRAYIDLRAEIPTDETAEELAIAILTWLADQHKLMDRFLQLTGINADSIRAMIGDQTLYFALTGFLMSHEPTMAEFCLANQVTMAWVRNCHIYLASGDVDILF